MLHFLRSAQGSAVAYTMARTLEGCHVQAEYQAMSLDVLKVETQHVSVMQGTAM